MQSKYKQHLAQYLELKNITQLPFKAKLYFSTLELTLEKTHSVILQKQELINNSFIQAFSHQNVDQKIFFMLKMIKFYRREIQNQNGPNQNIQFICQKDIKIVQTTCQMQVFSFGISRWTSIRFKYNKDKRSIILTHKKNIINIQFQHFLVRRSKKHKRTLVFQSIKNSKNKQKISLYFQQILFNQLQGEIFNGIFQMRKKDFINLISRSQNQDQSHSQPHLIFLSKENILSFIKFKTEITKLTKQKNLAYESIFQKQYLNSKITLYRGVKINKLFRVQFHIDEQMNKFKQQYLIKLKEKYIYQRQYSVVEEYSNKYEVINQRFLFNNKIFQQISIKQQNSYENSQFFWIKGIENIICVNFIEFICIKVIGLGQNQCQVTVTASLKIDKQFTQQIAKQFMVQFYEMTQRNQQAHEKIQNTLQQQFYTILMQQQGDLQLELEIQDQGNRSINSQIQEISQEKQIQNAQIHKKKINTKCQVLNPLELQAKIMKNHYHFGQFGRYKSGGVICINEVSINEQKKMIKKVVTSLGSKLFQLKTGGILNVSLPVQIFKKESHLQTIAKNFLIAPIFLDPFQNSKDYLQRIKFCILTTFSMNNLGIGSAKPFNPILGQTLQSWIGGCPIYFQQLSHHPPSSAYYMVGRGYTISGVISAKISVSSINSGKFWSEKPHTLTFDDGSVILFTLPKTIIRGLIYGDRYFCFEGRCYVYDTKNHYFGQIQYGPIKRGFLQSSTEPEDYLHGKIYRTTTDFAQKFKQSACFPQKQNIAKQICKIEGICSQQIKIDNKVYTNFQKLLSYTLQSEQMALPSDSSYRKDLSAYIADDLVLAQTEKQNMQNMQRRDKKLRDKYNSLFQQS